MKDRGLAARAEPRGAGTQHSYQKKSTVRLLQYIGTQDARPARARARERVSAQKHTCSARYLPRMTEHKSTAVDLHPSNEVRYAATMHLPSDVAELLASSKDPVSVTFCTGGGDLKIGKSSFRFTTMPEGSLELYEPDRSSSGAWSGLGEVKERLTVRASLDSASGLAARQQLKNASSAVDEAKEQQRITRVDPESAKRSRGTVAVVSRKRPAIAPAPKQPPSKVAASTSSFPPPRSPPVPPVPRRRGLLLPPRKYQSKSGPYTCSRLGRRRSQAFTIRSKASKRRCSESHHTTCWRVGCWRVGCYVPAKLSPKRLPRASCT